MSLGSHATQPHTGLTATAATVRRRPGSTSAASLADAPGSLVLGRYRLHKPLGAGGFGAVWLARDEHLERDVAVKILPRARVIGGRFEREARAAARLSHPSIVTLYEAAVDADGAYLVSELVLGATLGQLLEAGRLSDRDIVTIGIALCDALEHAHAQGVVHRDVKPSNVLVPEHPSSPSQVAKLTDFGVARLIGGNTLTRTGDVVGTDAYMAPEQAEGREADASADLYSLALVLYEALTGINPLATSVAGRSRRLGAHLPPVRRHRRELPRELGQCIDLALRPRSRERGTVANLRNGLAVTVTGLDDLPGVVGSPWPLPRRTATASWSLPDQEQQHPPGADRASPPAHAPLRWPERGLAAAGAAVIGAWLAASTSGAHAVAPALVALLSALAVAVLPRLGWLALSAAGAGVLAADGHAGTGLVVLIALLVPVVLMPRAPARWPLVAAAPALGMISLTGAWPALAGRDATLWRRAGLGATGWIWVALAGLLAGRGVYTKLPPGIPPKAVWTGSLDQTVGRVLGPLLDSGLLSAAIIWAIAAAILPWIVRGPAPIRVVVVVVWSAVLASSTTTLIGGLHSGITFRPGVVVLGAVAGAIVALVPTLLRRWHAASPSADTAAGLA